MLKKAWKEAQSHEACREIQNALATIKRMADVIKEDSEVKVMVPLKQNEISTILEASRALRQKNYNLYMKLRLIAKRRINESEEL